MNTDMKTKALIWIWYLESVVCRNETKNATRYVQYRLTLSTHKMHIFTHTEVTILCLLFTQLLIINIDMKTKALIRFWCLQSVVCRNETKTSTRYPFHIALTSKVKKSNVYETLYLICYVGLTLSASIPILA